MDEIELDSTEEQVSAVSSYCIESHLILINDGRFRMCCTSSDQCLSRFCLEESHFGLAGGESRCQNNCVQVITEEVGACCLNNDDCMSDFCSYGVCASNCAENDYFLMDRSLGECCDYDSHCNSGSCSEDLKICVMNIAEEELPTQTPESEEQEESGERVGVEEENEE